ncbi:MAG: ABC transporter ATP-binding protein [Opitutaceae bacterium]|nr:ABC transporter ATP-binding protein [Opitutaceae bacterium]
MNIIETQGLSCRYGRHEAVHDLDLRIPAGGVTALLGPNGAGKSTTIRLLMNLITPSAGQARVLGVDTRRLGPAQFRRIGYVSENQELPRWMTVARFLDHCRALYPSWDRELEGTLLKQLDLPLDRRLDQLSRGMLMKASLLSSLAYRPELLVLDEPFSGLDALVREEFMQSILEVSAPGAWTVLIASHDIEEVERFCDRVVLLEAGRKRIDENTEALQARFRRIEITLAGEPPPSSALPTNWHGYERAGQLVRFVESAYDRAETETTCRMLFPSASVVAHPMSLREIFITLARTGRAEAREASAA